MLIRTFRGAAAGPVGHILRAAVPALQTRPISHGVPFAFWQFLSHSLSLMPEHLALFEQQLALDHKQNELARYEQQKWHITDNISSVVQ